MMDYWILIVIGIWLFYSALSIYGVFNFPAFSAGEKFSQTLLILVLPIIGAIIVNHKMGVKFEEARQKDATYELPLWLYNKSGSSQDWDFDD